MNRQDVEQLIRSFGFKHFRWADPRRFVVADWVRMKCRFGCPEYGRTASCPPHLPSVDECRRFFRDYREAVVFHFQKQVAKPEERFEWTRSVNRELLKLEREVFLRGREKAFLLFLDSCNLCPECSADRRTCKLPKMARPTPEALAVDVYASVRRLGYPIQVLSDHSQTMNRYAFLLLR
jgi:predicted metal-binding protein